jgi:prepilin peptidase dependent protein B
MFVIRKATPPSSGTGLPNRARQAGATLMETMISLALSVLVITGMVILMGNSMGTTNRITQSAQLNDQLRNVMSMMTRDVRRANYSAASILCYGNPDCGTQPLTLQQCADGDDDCAAAAVGDLVVADGCLIFQLDRAVRDSDDEIVIDGDATNNSKGGFRRVEVEVYRPGRPDEPDVVGVIQMWVNAEADVPGCGDADDADGWLPVTDPNIVDIVAFTINDDLSEDKEIFQDSGLSSYLQRQRYLELALEGELNLEQSMGWTAGADEQMTRRRVQDVITVRNDYLSPPVEL